jgi:hypothetical protein
MDGLGTPNQNLPKPKSTKIYSKTLSGKIRTSPIPPCFFHKFLKEILPLKQAEAVKSMTVNIQPLISPKSVKPILCIKTKSCLPQSKTHRN